MISQGNWAEAKAENPLDYQAQVYTVGLFIIVCLFVCFQHSYGQNGRLKLSEEDISYIHVYV